MYYSEHGLEGIIHPYHPVIYFPSLMGTPEIRIRVVPTAPYRRLKGRKRSLTVSCQKQVLCVHRYCTYPAHTSKQTARII